jgi:hypothetical protein
VAKTERNVKTLTSIDNMKTTLVVVSLALPLGVGPAKASDAKVCTQTTPVDGASVPATAKTRFLDLLPETSDLLDATALQVTNTWIGEPSDPSVTFGSALTLVGDEFKGDGELHNSREGDNGSPPKKRNSAISRDDARAFLCAALQAPVEERAYEPYISHTDDYPALSFKFEGRTGPLKVFTQSQPHVVQSHWVRTPWAIVYHGRTFVVTAADIDLALRRLPRTLDLGTDSDTPSQK